MTVQYNAERGPGSSGAYLFHPKPDWGSAGAHVA
jgi:hypothetical protein